MLAGGARESEGLAASGKGRLEGTRLPAEKRDRENPAGSVQARWAAALSVGIAAALVSWSVRSTLDLANHDPSFNGTILHVFYAYVALMTLFCLGVLVTEALVLLSPGWLKGPSGRTQIVLLTLLLVFGVAGQTCMRIAARMKTAPDRIVLDSALQMEIAAEMLAEGRNPYSETYHGTALETWGKGYEDAPALYHFVYPPLGLLATFGARELSMGIVGAYDQRFLTLPCALLAFFLACRFLRGSPWRVPLIAAAFFNPWAIPSIEQGRLESALLLLIVVLLQLLKDRRHALAGVVTGLCIVTKTTFVPLAPFVLIHAATHGNWNRRSCGIFGFLHHSTSCWAAMAATVAIFLAPFLLWDASSFVDDTWLSVSGMADHPFPITESLYWGIGRVVVGLGLVENMGSWFAFSLVQIPICLVIAWFGLRCVYRDPSPVRVMGGFALLAIAFFYVSRFSDPTYVASLVSYAVLAAGFRSPAAVRAPQPYRAEDWVPLPEPARPHPVFATKHVKLAVPSNFN